MFLRNRKNRPKYSEEDEPEENAEDQPETGSSSDLVISSFTSISTKQFETDNKSEATKEERYQPIS